VRLTESITAIAAGQQHSLLINSTGKVYSTGDNQFGQLGLGDQISRFEPTLVSALSGYRIVKIACGSHSAAISEQNQLFLFGRAALADLLLPTQLDPTAHFHDISVGDNFGCALDLDGNIYSWGSNENGELCQGDFRNRKAPALIASL